MATFPSSTASASSVGTPTLPLTGGAVDGAGSRKQQRGKRSDGATATMGVGEFVEASFASFERAFPGASTTSAAAATSDAKLVGRGAESHSVIAAGVGEDHPASEDGAVAATEGSFADEDDDSRLDDDALLDRASFMTLLTTLYLPLLLLWLRRSMFGTASLLRSLLIGHALRLLLAYAIVLPDAPPAWAADLGGRIRKSSMWRYIVGFGVFLADAILGPEDGTGGALGGSEGRHHRGGETWPPPALTALAVITVVAFVVHPDGLTWIVLGKIRDGIRYSIDSLALGFGMVQDGTIPTLAASGSLASLALLAGIIHRTLTSKHKSHAPAPNPERSRHKGKKGKKGRGRHGGGASRGGAQARGRGRIRGGHYRSAKELASSPLRKVSRSRSRSRTASPPPLALTGSRNRMESDGTISVVQGTKAQHSPDEVRSSPPSKQQLQTTEVQFGGHLKDTSTRRTAGKPAAQSQPSPKKPVVTPPGAKRGTVTDRTMQKKEHESSGKQVGSTGGGRGGGGRRRRRGKKGPKHGAGADKGTKQEPRKPTTVGELPLQGDRLLHHPPPPSSVVIAPPKSAQNSCLPGVSQYSQSFGTKPTPPPSPQLYSTVSLYQEEACFSGRNSTPGASARDGCASETSSFFSSTSPLPSTNSQIGAVNPQMRLQPIGLPSFQPATPSITPQQSFQAAPGPGTSQLLHRSVSMPTQQQSMCGFNTGSAEFVDMALSQPTQASISTAGVIGEHSSALRYNVPNYASTYSYSQGSGRYTPGKIELAAFLAQVGLVGTSCAAILEDLSDVDALAQLTKEKFELYNIGDAKQAEISIMLEARRRRLAGETGGSQKKSWNIAPVRPPPGLENAYRENHGIVGTNAIADVQHSPPFFASSSTLVSGAATGSGAGTSTGYMLSMRNVNSSESRVRCDTGESWTSSCDDATKVAPPLSPLPRPFTHVEDLVNEEGHDDDSKIEADLQELGGQMVGSILDF
mmetsp:Transcript_40374/g.121655  ORF Transcript_40374/g.121655 Transcript_40374/m.121655 type:complete len:975 (-) Transcript_40374:246-3170(-)